MKISIQNFGPIRKAEYDLSKDLTFVYGKNNVGKSYGISLLYLVVKNFAIESSVPLRSFYNPVIFFTKEAQKDLVGAAKGEEMPAGSEKNITEAIVEYVKQFFEETFIGKLQNSLVASFNGIGTLENRLSGEPTRISLKFRSLLLDIGIRGDSLYISQVKLKKDVFLKRITVHRHVKDQAGATDVKAYYHDEKVFIEDISRYVYELFLDCASDITRLIKNVYYLPASRSGLYRALNTFSVMLAELAKNRSFFRNRVSFPNISEQDLDYFTRLSEIRIRKTPTPFLETITKLEKDLLKGEVQFDQKEKRIVYRPQHTDLGLEIVGTSSMVAEVSPIALYFKYIVGTDEDAVRGRRVSATALPLVFIEEPEAHLHPDAQVILAEMFVRLINDGCKLVITSHSNYMFNKINNLLISRSLDRKKIECLILKESEKGSNSEVLDISNAGIADQNFVGITESLYMERVDAFKSANQEISND